MRLLIDVYAADGVTRLGEGPVTTAEGAEVKRKLDGLGEISIDLPATDLRARALLANERFVRIWVEEPMPDGPLLVEKGAGIVRTRTTKAMDSGYGLAYKGPSAMDALTRRIVRLNRQYGNPTAETIAAIAEDLISLVPGWGVTFEGTTGAQLAAARFAGVNIFKALARLVIENDLHLREYADAPNTVEIGAFGTQTRVLITNADNMTRALHRNRDIILISDLTEEENTRAVVNRMFPLGAGEGQAAVTLRDSTRAAPYPILSLVEDDGATVYYIEDTDSQGDYGVIESVVTFKEIGPIANSGPAKVIAANALYDAAAADLRRRSRAQKVYSVAGVKAQQRLNPGDQVRLVYHGLVYQNGSPVEWLDVDDWFWVLEVNERFSTAGTSMTLKVSVVDRLPKDIIAATLNGMGAIAVRNLAIQTFPIYYTDTWQDYIECIISTTGRDANFVFRPTDLLTDITRVRLEFRSFPLYTFVTFNPDFQSAGTDFDYAFNIIESDQHPKGLRLFINDEEVTSALGGPWNPLGTPPDPAPNDQIDESVDITEIIREGGLDQEYRIRFKATFDPFGDANRVPGFTSPNQGGVGSSGVIQCSVRVLGVAQAIIPG